jgi:hypothetical protein
MSSAPSANRRPIRPNDPQDVIPLLTKEGLGVVERRGEDVTRYPSASFAGSVGLGAERVQVTSKPASIERERGAGKTQK